VRVKVIVEVKVGVYVLVDVGEGVVVCVSVGLGVRVGVGKSVDPGVFVDKFVPVGSDTPGVCVELSEGTTVDSVRVVCGTGQVDCVQIPPPGVCVSVINGEPGVSLGENWIGNPEQEIIIITRKNIKVYFLIIKAILMENDEIH
jgi:hypothetical protein